MQCSAASVIVLSGFAILSTPALAQAPPPPSRLLSAPELSRVDLEAWLDSLVPDALRKADIAGLVVSVVKDGQLVLAKGFGYANVAAGTPMDPGRTVLRVASVSKAFTATAVMQLVERGKLELDRDVNEYLDFTIPPAFDKPVTLRHLLTHTAGFEEIAYKRYSPPQTLRQHVLRVPDRIYPPGTIPAYSNYGLALAGYIVARVSGESIVQYVQGHILDPLGMQHSSFAMTLPAALEASLGKNYPLASAAEPYSPELIAQLTPAEAPASALATTAHDMVRFMVAHLQGGRYGDAELLEPGTVRLMQEAEFVPISGAHPIALGLFRSDYNGHRVIGHSGDGEGAHAEMKLLPDDNVGLFVAVNSDGAVDTFLPAAFALRARLFEQFMERYFPAPAGADEPTTATAAEHARLVAGEYAWSRQQRGDFQEAIGLIQRFALDAVVRANADGTIQTTAYHTLEPNGRSQTWREVRPFVWREVGGDARLVMGVQNGKVETLWTDQSPSFWVNLRVPTLLSARLNVPLFGLSAAALALTLLLWPVAALVRHRTGRATVLSVPERLARRLTLVAVLLGVLYVLGWGFALAADLASTVGAEPWIRLIQGLGLVSVAGAAIAAWNAWITWRGKRSAWARAGSLVPAVALLYLVWFSFAFHLISARLN